MINRLAKAHWTYDKKERKRNIKKNNLKITAFANINRKHELGG